MGAFPSAAVAPFSTARLSQSCVISVTRHLVRASVRAVWIPIEAVQLLARICDRRMKAKRIPRPFARVIFEKQPHAK
jgi:hypothetical protein